MKVFSISIILLLIIVSPLFAGGQKEEPKEPENTMMMMENNENKGNESEPFIIYASPQQIMKLAESKPTVLFFHASWCPSCREAREDLTKQRAALENVHLVLVDYDNSDELQEKYGITYQHTFVQVDSQGEALTKWNGGGAEELLANLKGKGM